jgi:hypothetical protein
MKQDKHTTTKKKFKSKSNKNLLHQVQNRVTNKKMGNKTAKAEEEGRRNEVEHYR